MLRVASTESLKVAPLLAAGSTIWLAGALSESPLGKLVLVRAIGSNRDALLPLAPWDGPQ